ncbi:MAG: glycosyl hydrolase, partial [Gemmatimonadetes bacterium]|nr:glycosyl hydrolase [Gemmatimonadota bacterium]
EYGRAICYSGYREGQTPVEAVYPSHDEVAEDLRLLEGHWRYLRLYDCSPHAEIVLEVIRREGLDFQVMLGAEMRAEVSNPKCPWGADYDDALLAENHRHNAEEIERAIVLAEHYESLIFSVSVGNEASVEWTDHQVPVDTLIRYARRVKQALPQPVTFCENYVPWTDELAPLAAELDFLSVHTYPVWEFQGIDNALAYTRSNVEGVAQRYPDKPVVISEAGWTTASNGRGIEPWNASQDLQAHYYQQLMRWADEEQILTFVFEAFDEPWKGSPDPLEPEKHWGLFTVDRRPKMAVRDLFPDPVRRDP